MEKACDEGWQGVVSDAKAGGDDVQVHDDLRDEQGCGGPVEAEGTREKVTGYASETGAQDIVGG